jgi:hypothetical protein
MDIGVRWALCVLLVRLSGSVAAFVGGRKGEGGAGPPGLSLLGMVAGFAPGCGPPLRQRDGVLDLSSGLAL